MLIFVIIRKQWTDELFFDYCGANFYRKHSCFMSGRLNTYTAFLCLYYITSQYLCQYFKTIHFGYRNNEKSDTLNTVPLYYSTLLRDLDDSVALIVKQFIRFIDLRERIGIRDQRLGIELALGNELQRFLAITAVNAAGLEGQIFAVHIGQRQGLFLFLWYNISIALF